MKTLQKTINDIQSTIDATDWHQTMPETWMAVRMIEAKAKLIEAKKKLEKLVEVAG